MTAPLTARNTSVLPVGIAALRAGQHADHQQRAVGEWGQVFGDAVAPTAILNRLLHHSQVITIRGDSYRLRDTRRSGLLQKAAAPTPITSEN